MNSVDISGRMTREPEVRYAADKPFARFCLAVNRRFKQDGQPNADFVNCTAFGKMAEFVEKYGRKGVKFEVHGRLEAIRTRTVTPFIQTTVWLSQSSLQKVRAVAVNRKTAVQFQAGAGL